MKTLKMTELLLLLNVNEVEHDIEQHDDDIYMINIYELKNVEYKIFINLMSEDIIIEDINDKKYKIEDLIRKL